MKRFFILIYELCEFFYFPTFTPRIYIFLSYYTICLGKKRQETQMFVIRAIRRNKRK
mgnify:CR=1 FL=1